MNARLPDGHLVFQRAVHGVLVGEAWLDLYGGRVGRRMAPTLWLAGIACSDEDVCVRNFQPMELAAAEASLGVDAEAQADGLRGLDAASWTAFETELLLDLDVSAPEGHAQPHVDGCETLVVITSEVDGTAEVEGAFVAAVGGLAEHWAEGVVLSVSGDVTSRGALVDERIVGLGYSLDDIDGVTLSLQGTLWGGTAALGADFRDGEGVRIAYGEWTPSPETGTRANPTEPPPPRATNRGVIAERE